jgi:hypothetical protein
MEDGVFYFTHPEKILLVMYSDVMEINIDKEFKVALDKTEKTLLV